MSDLPHSPGTPPEADTERGATEVRIPHRITRPPGSVLAILVAIVGLELLMWMPGVRGFCFATLAFDPQRLEAGGGLYPGHGVAMFFSHIFLHIGPLHMLGNALALYLLWYLMPWMYTSDFLVVFFSAALGGAMLFLWQGPEGASMTGTSGAVAGLAAVWGLYEMFLIHRGFVLTLRPKRTAVLVGLVVVGVLLNIDHQLSTAWQAHVGGAIVGAGFGAGLILRAIWEKRFGPTDPREIDT